MKDRRFYIHLKYFFPALCLLFLAGIDLAKAADLPNEIGLVPILEYHRILPKEGDFVRSIDNFKKDLEWLYNNDYVLITVKDYLDQNFNLPKGKKPVIFTWDDSTKSQFNYLDSGEIDPNSGIGIMDAFYKIHPDFGRASIFYVNATLFEQKDLAQKKLQYLLETGREIGNHTVNHTSLGKSSPEIIQQELANLIKIVQKTLGQSVVLDTLAYPFGSVPKEPNFQFISKGSFEGINYSNRLGLLVGADPAHVPYSSKFEALYTPRIQAMDVEWKRWFGRLPGETKKTNSEVFTSFVSDGYAEIVSVPKSSKMAKYFAEEKLRAGLTACVYADEAELSKCLVGQTPLEKVTTEALPIVATGQTVMVSGDSQIIMPKSDSTQTTDKLEPMAYDIFWENFESRVKKTFLSVAQEIKQTLPTIEFRTLPPELIQKDGKFYYTVQAGETIGKIAERFLFYTSYYLSFQLIDALNEANSLKNGAVIIGQELIIPNVELIIFDKKPSVPFKKAIYWTGYTAGTKTALEQLDMLIKSGGNAVVFDIKELEGKLFYNSKIPLANELGLVKPLIPDIPKLVRTLHRKGVYVIARQVVFRDESLAKKKTDWTPRRRGTDQPWVNNEGLSWMDPSNPDVQAYNLAIAKEVAEMGVDEVQFDYIRFPAAGDVDNADFFYDEKALGRADVIAGFLEKVYQELKPMGAHVSADVFGVVAWSNGLDARIIGQDITKMGRYLDAIYPMVYPSHFGPGYAGHANPGSEPYFFVAESSKKFLLLVEGTGAEVRPWIQGFAWRAPNFGTEYVRQQIKAVKDLDLGGYAIWSAGNKYEVSWPALK